MLEETATQEEYLVLVRGAATKVGLHGPAQPEPVRRADQLLLQHLYNLNIAQLLPHDWIQYYSCQNTKSKLLWYDHPILYVSV